MGRGPHSRPSDRDKRAVAEPCEAVTSWETDRVWDGLHRVHWGPGPSRPATWRVSCFGGAAPNKPAEPEHVSLPRATPPEVLGQEAAFDRQRVDTDVGALRLSDVCERPAALALDVPRSRAASKRRSCGRRRLLLSPSPPGAARGAGPADASRDKAGGGRGRVSDPAGLGAAVCTSCGGGTPRGHRRGDRRRCRVLGAQRYHQTELRFTETDARAETQRLGRRAGPGAAAEHPQPHPPCFGAWWKFSTSNMYILFFTVFPPKKL